MIVQKDIEWGNLKDKMCMDMDRIVIWNMGKASKQVGVVYF